MYRTVLLRNIHQKWVRYVRLFVLLLISFSHNFSISKYRTLLLLTLHSTALPCSVRENFQFLDDEQATEYEQEEQEV